jgi:hypothetical protein
MHQSRAAGPIKSATREWVLHHEPCARRSLADLAGLTILRRSMARRDVVAARLNRRGERPHSSHRATRTSDSMVPPPRLERGTPRSTIWCSNQLSYGGPARRETRSNRPRLQAARTPGPRQITLCGTRGAGLVWRGRGPLPANFPHPCQTFGRRK